MEFGMLSNLVDDLERRITKFFRNNVERKCRRSSASNSMDLNLLWS